ncbi:MAG: serine protease [Desulfocapsa sp.]|nr:serine protease [Desulfocapsa sp.]
MASEKIAKRIARSMVSILSPLGKATGFFVDSGGHILTTRDVVELSETGLEKVNNQKTLLEQIIVLEQKRLQTIRHKMSLLPPGDEKEQFKRLSSEKKEELFKSLSEKQNLERLLGSAGKQLQDLLPEIRVVSAEGKQLQLKSISVSSISNLALLHVDTTDLKYRPLRPRPILLFDGDIVYAGGYPEQSLLPVQKGKMVGYQVMENQEQICSDIQIRKEDRGGPLLDRYGNVCGLNTVPFEDGREKECAIPLSAAFNEFSSSITLRIEAVSYKKLAGNVEQ